MRAVYTADGYPDFKMVWALPTPFCFMWGGRGTGKTISALIYAVSHNIPFMYLRRTITILDNLVNDQFNPVAEVNRILGTDLTIARVSRYILGVYHSEQTEDGKTVPVGPPIGYMAPLSGFASVRGFSGAHIDLMIYDEFIPSPEERAIKQEGWAFLNAVETINRNRELEGREALRVWCLANSNNLANPIFMELGLVTKAEKMELGGKEIQILPNYAATLITLKNSPISTRKRDQSSLYKLAHKSTFAEMALDNSFRLDTSRYVSRPLKEYKPIVTVGELTVYEHKSSAALYVSPHRTGGPPIYSVRQLDQFRVHYRWLTLKYLQKQIEFESYYTDQLFANFVDNRYKV